MIVSIFIGREISKESSTWQQELIKAILSDLEEGMKNVDLAATRNANTQN
jgi:hypothetical protein